MRRCTGCRPSRREPAATAWDGGADAHLSRIVVALLAVSSLLVLVVVLLVDPARAAAPSPPMAASSPGDGVPAAFRGADLALGERLLREHRCAACHASQVGGDGSDIYDPGGRVRTPESLLAAVQGCATKLNLPLFPEDVAAIAAVLNRDHYHFHAGP